MTCKDKVGIPLLHQKCVLHWYHMYLLHPRMDRTEAMIFQHLFCPGIINAIWKEVTNFDTYQRTKWSNKKYGKLPAKEAENVP